jgi:hypothetical protein
MLVGNKDRTTDPLAIVIPTQQGGGINGPELEAFILKTVEDALEAGAGGAPAIDLTALVTLQQKVAAVEAVNATQNTKIAAVETVNTTQNTKIAALEATGVASTAAVFGVADTAWTACTLAAGITDKLWARVYKGRVIFKAAASATGTASSLSTGRLTSQSSFKQIATLPGGFPKPNGNQDWYCPVTTYQQGQSVPYGTTLIYMSGSSGNMYVVAGNVAIDGIFPDSAAGYPIGAI